MLFISGRGGAQPNQRQTHEFQSRNRDAFHIRCQPGGDMEHHREIQVSISQSRCFSYQVVFWLHWTTPKPKVSISQSRCFSYQASVDGARLFAKASFNLAIEMLFISGRRLPNGTAWAGSGFQSRNRDAFHIRVRESSLGVVVARFNLAIEMLFISGPCPRSP